MNSTSSTIESIAIDRAKIKFAVGLAALIAISPFAINHLLHGRYFIGTLSLLIGIILFLNAWTISRGRHFPYLTLFGLVPVSIVFLIVSLFEQGIIGALWCYPAIICFQFMFDSKQSLAINILVLICTLPFVWWLIDTHVAMRITATLLAVSAFSVIFGRLIENQQRELALREVQRRESMAGVSHELRTPMATIMAQVEAMRDNIRDRDDAQLARLSSSVDHLSSLFDDLYQLTLADVGALECEHNALNLSALVEECTKIFENQIEANRLSISTSIEQDLTILGDAKRIRQILDNLLSNCHRYCDVGASIHVLLEKSGENALLKVSDSGPGVSNETLLQLFDRFYRAEESRSRKKGGVGLGLAMVKTYVSAHDGTVEASHSQSGGLEIIIQLPLKRKK